MDEIIPEASTSEIIEVDIILPDETIKENYKVFLRNKVSEEKFRIWKKEVEEPPPSMKDVSLVLLGDQGSETLMGDNHNIEYYLHDLASGKIKYVLRSQAENMVVIQ